MTIPYGKPHATYPERVAVLRSRGLECPDEAVAIELLKTVGYYRLSAYVYPFRLLLDAGDQRQQSPTHFRSEQIRSGTTLEMVEQLWLFDRRLRLLVLDAVETIEVGLRSRIGYRLGERDIFGHLNPRSLNETACGRAARRPTFDIRTVHDEWLSLYRRAVHAAKEDFIRHNVHKYNEIPIWIALEVLTFGNTVMLFNLMRQEDQTALARELDLKGGSLLGGWLETVNYVRNVAAHHARLWNRTTTLKVRRPKPAQVNASLQHLADGSVLTEKIYASLAVMAHLATRFDINSTWPARLRRHVESFPTQTGMSPMASMGFPAGWNTLELWQPDR